MHALVPHCLCALALLAFRAPVSAPCVSAEEIVIHVDGSSGDDNAAGTKDHPLRTISAAIAKLPDPLDRSAQIHVAPGEYTEGVQTVIVAGRLRQGVKEDLKTVTEAIRIRGGTI